MPRISPEIAILLANVDSAYNHKSWHGTNLRGTIRRVDARQAAARPAPKRKCIAEIVVHAAYWKYAARRRLRGDKRGSFPLKGSNWFKLPEPFTAAAWRDCVKLLDNEHRQLREAVAAIPASQLNATFAGRKVTYLCLINGIAAHDLYHAGQVQYIKAMLKNT